MSHIPVEQGWVSMWRTFETSEQDRTHKKTRWQSILLERCKKRQFSCNTEQQQNNRIPKSIMSPLDVGCTLHEMRQVRWRHSIRSATRKL